MVPIGSKHDPVMTHKLNTLLTYAFNLNDSVLIISELQPKALAVLDIKKTKHGLTLASIWPKK